MAKILIQKQTRHGYCGTPVYRLWAIVVSRCEQKTSQNYKYYGGKGIKVCDEWRNSPKAFIDWALLNGYKKGLEIDRIDGNGNYEPSNCKFVTHAENCAPNKRKIFSNNKTGHTGISQSKWGTFEVYVTKNGKQTYVGVRKTLEAALELKNTVLKTQQND
jgi:hypothetical protein